jgi:hypothetical protein
MQDSTGPRRKTANGAKTNAHSKKNTLRARDVIKFSFFIAQKPREHVFLPAPPLITTFSLSRMQLNPVLMVLISYHVFFCMLQLGAIKNDRQKRYAADTLRRLWP